jgi:hypothetical protein
MILFKTTAVKTSNPTEELFLCQASTNKIGFQTQNYFLGGKHNETHYKKKGPWGPSA